MYTYIYIYTFSYHVYLIIIYTYIHIIYIYIHIPVVLVSLSITVFLTQVAMVDLADCTWDCYEERAVRNHGCDHETSEAPRSFL